MADTIPWTSIKALSFDIYGTLIDWENGIASAARSTALSLYLPYSHKDLMIGIESHDVEVQREHPTMLQRDSIAEGLRRYAKQLGIVEKGYLTEREVEDAVKQYGGMIAGYPAFEDSVAAIQRLAKRYKLVPLTNVDQQSFEGTMAGPLKGCEFDAVCTAEEIGSYKPDLKNFHFLLKTLKEDFGVEKEDLVHVAQGLYHDHGPAKELGLKSVWVDRGGVMGGDPEGAQEKYGFQLRVETLRELADIVDKAWEKA
jgi:2-haloalkanoic acid dehalogenase type II